MSNPRLVVLSLAALLAVPPLAHAKPGCGGPFKKSCLKALYKCFKANGACTTQTKQPTIVSDPVTFVVTYVGKFETDTCWANGAKEKLSIDPNTQMGTFTGTNSNGKACLSGTFAQMKTTFTRKGKTWTMETAADGSETVTCPTGKTETYTPDQLTAASPKCGGRGGAACTDGTCP